jgi:hypothetical protein
MKRIEQKRPRSYLGNFRKDAHEADFIHLQEALHAYRWVAQREPEHFRIVECVENGRELSAEEIHQKVLKFIEPFVAGA